MRGEAMAHSNNGGLAMGVAVHTDMATPPILKFGSEYLKQTYLVPVDQGRDDLLARDHRAGRRAPTWRASARARCATATST